ncbi:MAG: amidohydrolase/deacetylase family metallohydrolase [Chloroflexi bacterium]|nr:amidohydrolase/deacetylase family metallohydrolase [Chloroflexota bacterium]
MYDVLIKGGRVIDPAQGLDGKRDVAVSGDKIALVADEIPAMECRKVIDAAGKIVTPGLIDLHCHCYDGGVPDGLLPDDAGVKQGVTTVVDAGSAGQAIFGGLPKYVIPAARTTVFCFLHLGSQGLSIMPEIRDWEEIDLEATAAVIGAHPGLIKGVKLRLVGNIVASAGVKVVEMAKETAGKFGLPIMIHIGDLKRQVSPTLTREFLPLMESGDILSHVFTGNMGSILLEDGSVMPELRAAAERGVVLDIANGRNNLSFEVARKGMAQGIMPTTLSTDVVLPSLTTLVYGLTVTMSKFLALGLDIKQMIEMTTINSARALRIEDRKGSLKPGMDADVSVLEILSGTWELADSVPETLRVTELVSPVLVVKAGKVIPSAPVAQPPRIG